MSFFSILACIKPKLRYWQSNVFIILLLLITFMREDISKISSSLLSQKCVYIIYFWTNLDVSGNMPNTSKVLNKFFVYLQYIYCNMTKRTLVSKYLIYQLSRFVYPFTLKAYHNTNMSLYGAHSCFFFAFLRLCFRYRLHVQ